MGHQYTTNNGMPMALVGLNEYTEQDILGMSCMIWSRYYGLTLKSLDHGIECL